MIVSGDPQGGWSDYADRLDEMGVRPGRMITTTMPTTVTAFVRARLGIGLLGAFAARGPGTATLELPAPPWRREVRIVRAASKPAEAFVQLLRRHGPGLTECLASW